MFRALQSGQHDHWPGPQGWLVGSVTWGFTVYWTELDSDVLYFTPMHYDY